MGIGVEEAVLQQLLEAAVHAHLHHVVGVDAQLTHGIEVGELHPVDPFHRQDTTARGIAIDRWNRDARVVAVQIPEGFRIGCLIEVIHLLEHPAPEFVDQRNQVTADQADVAVQPCGDVADDVEVKRDLFPQAGALHLHGNLLTTLEGSLVHLTQGGG